jgi:aspartate/methionine/tyrosine aminotransferase
VAAHWGPATRGVLLASPSNPTGTSIAPEVMAQIVQLVRQRGGVTLVDEIYLPLSFDARFGHSALALGDDVVSINSFSKYFSMTGWRLGWMVLPPQLVGAVEKLAQNLYICPSTLAQRAALACFEPAALAEYEQRRAEFVRRRDYIVPALQGLGFDVPVPPDGAFYVWADCSRFLSAHNAGRGPASSWEFCFEMLQRAHVALTPGRDFGPAMAGHFIRLSFAASMPSLQTAMHRLGRELGKTQQR